MKYLHSSKLLGALIIPVLLSHTVPNLIMASDISDDFELTVLIDKSEYLLDEPIWLDILAVSTSDEVQTKNPPALGGWWFELLITNEDGDTLPYEGPRPLFSTVPVDTVGPGDTLYRCIDLLNAFGRKPPWLSATLSIEPGTYQLTAQYVKGEVSNTVSFSVVPPTGDERQAHALLTDGLRHRFSKQSEQGVRELEQLLTDYPTSAYAARACVRLAGAYSSKEPRRDEFDSVVRKLIVMYPNSGYVRFALDHYRDVMDRNALALIDSLKSETELLRFRMLAKQRGY